MGALLLVACATVEAPEQTDAITLGLGATDGSCGTTLCCANCPAHNLPFIHAFAVLNDVLEALKKEGHFKCKSSFLGALVDASETALPWNDFSTIKKGVGRRNDVAHRADLLERGECWKYVDAIKLELSTWGVV